MGQPVDDIEHIFEDQSTIFKLNLSFGFILFNNDTEEMQYHHSSANNNRVFDTPFQIRNREDLGQVCEAMQNINIHEWAWQQCPNSKWVVMDFTNATLVVLVKKYSIKKRGCGNYYFYYRLVLVKGCFVVKIVLKVVPRTGGTMKDSGVV
jgi:hypothetical protein